MIDIRGSSKRFNCGYRRHVGGAMVDARGQGAWSGRRSLDDVGGTAAEEFLQIVAELVTADAVQEEVD